jgi:hypothetical protein
LYTSAAVDVALHAQVQSWYVAKVKEAVAGFATALLGSFGHW